MNIASTHSPERDYRFRTEREYSRRNPELVLAPRGTEFQLRVWKALREIPTGSTATYKEIAEKIGIGTAQEVGEACAANAIAILIPCHGVIRADGSLSGYRWGIQRKRALLRREHEATHEPGSLKIDQNLVKLERSV